MKKIMLIFLVCMLFSVSCGIKTPIGGQGSENSTENQAVTSNDSETQPPANTYVPYVTVSAEELEALYASENYDEQLKELDLTDKTVIKSGDPYWWFYGSLDECLEASRSAFRYMFLGDIVYEVSIEKDGKITLMAMYDSETPFIKDLQRVGTEVMILDRLCHVNEVICFNGATYPVCLEGIINWFITDQGVYVKYYKDAEAEGIVFEAAEFECYRKAYYNFRLDPEVSQNEGVAPFTMILNNQDLFEKYSRETVTE